MNSQEGLQSIFHNKNLSQFSFYSLPVLNNCKINCIFHVSIKTAKNYWIIPAY